MEHQLTVWCVTDNKPGHLSQLRGLVRALSQRRELAVQWIDYRDRIRRRTAPGGGRPDLIIAAGHSTHLPALSLKRRFGGKLVAIMKPSLPRWLFDLCIIPEHDGVRPSRRVVTTLGALNDIEPAPDPQRNQGLILVGGNARHYQWSDARMIEQLHELERALPGHRWTLTTSRRTPASFVESAAGLQDDHFAVIPFEQTDREWLLGMYRDCGVIWVTEDSASMVYEALSAGAQVGVLSVPRRGEGRVSRGLDQLCASGRVTTLDQVKSLGTMPPAGAPLSEAARVAEYLDDCLQTRESG